MVPLSELIDQVSSYHPGADTKLIGKAYAYSSDMHEGQLRKSGDPYFIHPSQVAQIIAEMKLDTASICAALLHDVIEDTGATEKELTKLFGTEVSFLVDGVTKLGRINFTSKEDQQAESFRKMLVAMARDIRVLLVKLADRLDNMRTLEHMQVDSQERIARETLDIYAPLSGRLGIHWLKNELETLSFKHLYPDAYADLRRKAKRVAVDRNALVKDVTRRIERMLVERGFSVEVSGRTKHFYSIYRKMLRSGCDFEQVQDFAAFRVITETVSDCYAALGVVHSQWTPVPGRFKDYIALPKPNMYQSLHTTVLGPGHRRIEVQIRTREMHQTAEMGIAAHWKYKEGTGGVDEQDVAKFTWLRQLMEFQKDVQDPAEFLESVRIDLFHDEVFVFTPKGDVKVFPRGATPLDFAYAIHSDIGEHCTGARVNDALVPLKYQLRNGDTIEIITSPNQHPTKDWLDLVATGRARSRIRTYLRTNERQQSISLGRDILERAVRRKQMSFARLMKSNEIDKVVEALNVSNRDELFSLVGYGKVPVSNIIEILHPNETARLPASLRPGPLERVVEHARSRAKAYDGIQIGGIEDVLVRYAKCCNPVPGDLVIGWITRGRGVTVHRRECQKVMSSDPERRVEVTWSSKGTPVRPASIKVICSDRPGILKDVSHVFSESGFNISEATCRTSRDGRAVNVFQFGVNDVSKLRALIRNIMRIPGIQEVQRL
ncbi:MAG: bifunctional (p)ppGpp synthetase/guanosine-3',5'-bis(diphosphate) 3'-pyrophosphohydrolase [Myxococcales bacterium]|nr:bifunctional (p)ppGpp synthetase/guanosine-3',5'-bis(diphosphate) 3'-pyrophosphohydrolase [Myxococcales bacterium]MCB9707570.1 bifunctional (p)ppGpp synthetase/guanosine-3',5'-bis(diphosphate) 3'-pyrophosphohydrolase [Myxococcales bacterium]